MPLITDRSRKWIIAVVMSFLMVAFALPSWFGQHGGRPGEMMLANVYGKEKIRAGEFELARDEWGLLCGLSTGNFGDEPFMLSMRLFMGDPGQYVAQSEFFLAFRAAQIGVAEMNSNPSVFALLKREAMHHGFRPVKERVDAFIRANVDPRYENDARIGPLLRSAVGSMLMVDEYAQQASMAIKITKPQLTSQLAQSLQRLSVTAVVVDGPAFESQVPAPTPEQVRALYGKFADRAAGDSQGGSGRERENPFGFGYQQGNRLRLDYISVPRAEVLRAARAARTEYQWDVEAQKDYLQNQARYTIDVPVTRPAVQLGLTAPATTERKLKPFDEVRREILERLVNEKADQLGKQAERAVQTLIGAEFRRVHSAILKAHPSTATGGAKTAGATTLAAAPTTAPLALPMSNLGPAYDSFDFLRAVARKVEQDTGVKPAISTLAERFVTLAEMRQLEPIGQSLTDAQPGVRGTRQITATEYLFSRSKAFFDTARAAQQPGVVALEVLEPSPAFTDARGDVHILRVLESRTARTPELAEVEAEVKRDVQIAGTQELAVKAAEEISASLKDKPLTDVALSGRKFISIKDLQAGSTLPPELPLTPDSRQKFFEAAFGLLRADASEARPRTVVSLPRDRKAIVIELNGAENTVTGIEPSRLQLQGLQEMSTFERLGFLRRHFSAEATLQRTRFAPEPGMKSELLPIVTEKTKS